MATVFYERLNVAVEVDEENTSEVTRLEDLGYTKVEQKETKSKSDKNNKADKAKKNEAE